MTRIKEHTNNTASYLKFKKLANIIKKIVKEHMTKLLFRIDHFTTPSLTSRLHTLLNSSYLILPYWYHLHNFSDFGKLLAVVTLH